MGLLVTNSIMFTEGDYIEQAMISQSRAWTAAKQCIAQQSLYAYSMKGEATRLCMVIHLRYIIPCRAKATLLCYASVNAIVTHKIVRVDSPRLYLVHTNARFLCYSSKLAV